MSNTADDRSPVAYLHMADMLDDLYKKRMLLLYQRRVFNLSLAHCRSNSKIAVLGFDVVQFGNVIDVNDIRGIRQAHVVQWDEALPAREDFAVVLVQVKQRQRFVQHAGSAILKTRWLHGFPSAKIIASTSGPPTGI